MATAFQIRSSSIVSEIIDGEAIILDLRSGTYFSAQNAAAVIWDGIAAGFSVNAILARLAGCYDAEASALQAGMDSLLAQLIANDLVEAAALDDQPGEWSMVMPETKSAFVPPVLDSYADFQDLALLDPIHDVGDAGWPNRRVDSPLA